MRVMEPLSVNGFRVEVAAILGVDPSAVVQDAYILSDLAADSLQQVEILSLLAAQGCDRLPTEVDWEEMTVLRLFKIMNGQ